MFKRLIYRNYRAYSGLMFRFSRRVTKVGWLVLSAFFISAGLGMDTNLSLAYQTFTLLFFVIIAAFVGTFFSRSPLSIERVLPRFGTAGEVLRYQILVRNPGKRAQQSLSFLEDMPDPRPSFEEFISTPEPGEEKRNWYDRSQGWYRWEYLVAQNKKAVVKEHGLPLLPAKKTTEIPIELLPLKRGFLRLDGAHLFSPDPLGLFRAGKKIQAPASILILPKRYALPPIELPGKSKYQQGGVSMASAIGESEEFVSLRDYRAGDPLRHIHWRSFAKLGKPVVKEFQDEFFVRHALILDTFGVPLHSPLFEEAVSVAASFAYTIQTQDSLLDLMFAGPEAYCFTAGRGQGHTEQMLEVLAAVQPCRDRGFSSLRQLVVEHLDEVSGCIVVLMAWDKERQSFIEYLKVLGVPVLVLVVTQTDAPLPPGPMASEPEKFRILPLGNIGEALAKL